MYDIEFAPSALEDLKSFKKAEQTRILDGIETQLRHEPTAETRNRKRLRPNEVATWELRIGRFRVFYNADERESSAEEDLPDDGELTVRIEAVGFKVGSVLYIRHERRDL